MSYTKYIAAWSSSDLISSEALNHIESQWDEIKADADGHNHDTRYYYASDSIFFNNGFFTGFDADLLDGNHAAAVITSIYPNGAILIWPGSLANLPSGWFLCDGSAHSGYTTPDLRDRFVIGAGDLYTVGQTGGPATYNGTVALTATVTVGGHVLTTSEMLAHTHGYTDIFPSQSNANIGTGSCPDRIPTQTVYSEYVGGGQAHGHPGSTFAFGVSYDPRGSYRSLYYIMKCS